MRQAASSFRHCLRRRRGFHYCSECCRYYRAIAVQIFLLIFSRLLQNSDCRKHLQYKTTALCSTSGIMFEIQAGFRCKTNYAGQAVFKTLSNLVKPFHVISKYNADGPVARESKSPHRFLGSISFAIHRSICNRENG